jgi:DNA helicase-2/ATP-dependent DNA helicase PcrA
VVALSYKFCREIRNGLKEDRTYGDFAVLYRTNAQSRVIEDAFRREGIPYLIVGGLRFYDRKEIKDILAYLRLLINPTDSVSLKRIINIPARGIGDVTVEKIAAYARTKGCSMFDALSEIHGDDSLSSTAQRNIKKFVLIVHELHELVGRLSVPDLLQEVFSRTGYLEALKEEGGPEAESRIENLKELLTATLEFQERKVENGENGEDGNLAAFLD